MPRDRSARPRPAAPRIRCCYPVSMRILHCTALAVAAVLCRGRAGAAQPAQPAPATGDATFGDISPRHADRPRAGRRSPGPRRAGSSPRAARPRRPSISRITRFEMKYAPDWQPLEMRARSDGCKNAPVDASATSFCADDGDQRDHPGRQDRRRRRIRSAPGPSSCPTTCSAATRRWRARLSDRARSTPSCRSTSCRKATK